MARIRVHMAVVGWSSAVREIVHDLMHAFLIAREKVPKHRGVLQVGLWVSLLSMYECRKLDSVTNEENRRVVPNHIPVALIGIELD